MAAPSTDVDRSTRCRALVGGFGVPGLRDLDFGRNFVSYSEHLDWPDDVVVEEIPSSALLVLHRLQELRPAKLVIVVATARTPERPGEVRRYDLLHPPPVDVYEQMADALTDGTGLSHTLALARQWGALPETVVIEVEPAETDLGLGFSEEVGAALDRVLALVRDELGEAEPPRTSAPDMAVDQSCPPDPRHVPGRRSSSVRFDQLPHVEGLALSARFHPGDPGRRTGSDWCEVVPLTDGWTEVLIGEVLGEGLDAVAAISRLRTAVRASASSDGRHPGQVLTHLDRVVRATRMGQIATALCLAINPRRGEVRMANAGHCPPLLCASDGPAALWEEARSTPLGATPDHGRGEASFSFPLDSVLLLFTSGLVESPHRPTSDRMTELGLVAGEGPRDPEALCDRILVAAQPGLPPGEGGRLLAIGRPGAARDARDTQG